MVVIDIGLNDLLQPQHRAVERGDAGHATRRQAAPMPIVALRRVAARCGDSHARHLVVGRSRVEMRRPKQPAREGMSCGRAERAARGEARHEPEHARHRRRRARRAERGVRGRDRARGRAEAPADDGVEGGHPERGAAAGGLREQLDDEGADLSLV